jgi:ABC-type phosphate transport system substrate-binding protein
MKVKTFARTAVVGFAGALSLGLAAQPALADPTPPEFGAIVGSGSDTTQDVINGLGAVLDDGNDRDGDGNTTEPLIGSWDARGSANITSKDPATNANCDGDAPANDGFVRPNGSSQGRDALIASESGGSVLWRNETISGCLDFARSSAGPRSTGSAFTYVPFGVDAVTAAISSESLLPLDFPLEQLQGIYQCDIPDIAGVPVTPVLPQSGSGTRQFWVAAMGLTEAGIAAGDFPCLHLDESIQEHDGRVLEGNDDWILPFSVAQYIAQGNAENIELETGVIVQDRRGPAVLAAIDAQPDPAPHNPVQPVVGGVLNLDFPVVRDVFNVVPTADLSTTGAAFAGATSQVCGAESTIELFGFGFRGPTDPQDPAGGKRRCGATDLTGNS